jgi:hypothetical protein
VPNARQLAPAAMHVPLVPGTGTVLSLVCVITCPLLGVLAWAENLQAPRALLEPRPTSEVACEGAACMPLQGDALDDQIVQFGLEGRA